METGLIPADRVAWLRRKLPSEIKARKVADLRARLAASVARARVVARRRQLRNRLVVLVPGASGAQPVESLRPARARLDAHARAMLAAGWSMTRIARAYGVQRPAVVKWFQRRARPQGVERRRPAWVWRVCSACRCWGWFRQTHYRRERGQRVFCSSACYGARGRKARGRGRARAEG